MKNLMPNEGTAEPVREWRFVRSSHVDDELNLEARIVTSPESRWLVVQRIRGDRVMDRPYNNFRTLGMTSPSQEMDPHD